MKCQSCGEHEATLVWIGEGSLLDFVHGFHENWCEICTVKVQLEKAREMAAKIPELEAKLAKACK